MKLRYTDRSKVDVELAFAWYERQRKGLVSSSWTVLSLPYKTLSFFRKCIQYDIHVFAVVQLEDSRSRYFIQLKKMKSSFIPCLIIDKIRRRALSGYYRSRAESAGINRHRLGDERAPHKRRSCSIMAPSHVRLAARLNVKQLIRENAGLPLSSEITYPGCRPCGPVGKATIFCRWGDKET